MTTDDAPRGQDHVNGAAHSNAQAPQFPVVPGGLNHDIFAAKNDQVQTAKEPAHLIELLVEPTPLQDLGEDQVTNRDLLRIEQSFQQIGLGSWLASKVVEPDAP